MAQEVNIIVNGRTKQMPKDDATYEVIVKIAYETPPYGENTLFSVTYRKAEGGKTGSLTPGGTVKLKEGMIFDVTPTDKS